MSLEETTRIPGELLARMNAGADRPIRGDERRSQTLSQCRPTSRDQQ